MSLPAELPPWTVEDYLQFPEDGKRHELIAGEHHVAPAPRRSHQRLAARLTAWLVAHSEQHGLGEVYAAPFDVYLSQLDVVQPDLLFFCTERLHLLEEDGAHAAPDLVIEILSESSRQFDLTVKRKLYQRFGVAEYWVIDPALELIQVYRGPGLPLTSTPTAEANDTLTTPLLPGLEVALERLFGG